MSAASGHSADGPEALVVQLAAAGDHDAFAELVRRRQSWIRGLMRQCCGDADFADDLSQRVFLQAWRKIGQLKDPRKFGAWLKQLAVNEWLQHGRKKDALRSAEGEDSIAISHTDENSVRIDLNRAISALPEPVSLCIVLSYTARLSHPEIADMTGIQLGTVKSHIRRGSERLREILSAYDDNGAAKDVT